MKAELDLVADERDIFGDAEFAAFDGADGVEADRINLLQRRLPGLQ